jgi:hypothetical protein
MPRSSGPGFPRMLLFFFPSGWAGKDEWLSEDNLYSWDLLDRNKSQVCNDQVRHNWKEDFI